MVWFKENREILVGGSAKNNIPEYPESITFDSKRSIGFKLKNPGIQKNVKNWPFKIMKKLNQNILLGWRKRIFSWRYCFNNFCYLMKKHMKRKKLKKQ